MLLREQNRSGLNGSPDIHGPKTALRTALLWWDFPSKEHHPVSRDGKKRLNKRLVQRINGKNLRHSVAKKTRVFFGCSVDDEASCARWRGGRSIIKSWDVPLFHGFFVGVSNSREISKIHSREFFSPFPGIPGNPGNSILFKLLHYFRTINAFITFPYQYFDKSRSLTTKITPQYFVMLLWF